MEDIARFVGHARPATTAGYVKRLGRRPHAVAQRAAAILDGDQGDEDGEDDPNISGGVRNHPREIGSDRGSYRSGPPDEALPHPWTVGPGQGTLPNGPTPSGTVKWR